MQFSHNFVIYLIDKNLQQATELELQVEQNLQQYVAAYNRINWR